MELQNGLWFSEKKWKLTEIRHFDSHGSIGQNNKATLQLTETQGPPSVCISAKIHANLWKMNQMVGNGKFLDPREVLERSLSSTPTAGSRLEVFATFLLSNRMLISKILGAKFSRSPFLRVDVLFIDFWSFGAEIQTLGRPCVSVRWRVALLCWPMNPWGSKCRISVNFHFFSKNQRPNCSSNLQLPDAVRRIEIGSAPI